jgi:hypothetical protein
MSERRRRSELLDEMSTMVRCARKRLPDEPDAAHSHFSAMLDSRRIPTYPNVRKDRADA